MILTKKWLNDFIDLSDVDTQTIADTLNTLGLEVEAVKNISVVDDIVIGYVKSCEKHSNADKLNICQVDVGEQVLQIVCGANNVQADIYVAVSKIGAVLKNGLEIKQTNIRGIDSSGMICSSQELGFAPLNDGILILDDSIGKLEIGRELNDYDIFNDTIIDVDITPNRGDCLSILGIARDLACGLNKKLKKLKLSPITESIDAYMHKSIKIDFDINIKSHLQYKLIKQDVQKNNLLVDLFFSHIDDSNSKTPLQRLLGYVSHSTGVILNTYAIDYSDRRILELKVQKDNNLSTLSLKDGDILSVIGANINKDFGATSTTDWLLLEASYEPPTNLCINVAKNNIKTNPDIYFKSSRGSNPNISLGIDYLKHTINTQKLPTQIASGYSQTPNNENQEKTLICSHEELNSIIGNDIDISKMSDILNSLLLDTNIDVQHGRLIIKVPSFRHDIFGVQDIAEEILRVSNIDTIKSKPLFIEQKRVISKSFNQYLYKKELRNRCVNHGFFENISFVFSSRELQESLGFKVCDESIDIINPITNDLNTLRSTILPNLLQAVKNNKNNNFDSINLFEIGSIFDEKRDEALCLAFVSSGVLEKANIKNHGKPQMIDFYSFADRISNCIQGARLDILEQENNALIHPHQSASVWIENEYIGYISKLHSKIQNDMKIDDTFIAQFDLQKIFDLQKAKQFTQISKFPSVHRDLSLVINESLHYSKIRVFIEELKIEELKRFYPVDIFKLKNNEISLSIRFELQSSKHTLSEEDITSLVMDNIYNKLYSSMEITLRA